jgi:hypothetical protein
LSNRDYPVSIDDPEKDQDIMEDRLMDELCKRQYDADRNGRSFEFSINEVWQSCLGAFDKSYFDTFLLNYQKQKDYIEVLADNTKIRITQSGRRWCAVQQLLP